MVLLTTNLTVLAVPARNFSNPIIKSISIIFFLLENLFFLLKVMGIKNHYLNSKLDFFLF